jgi:hypothetical protein
VPKELTIIGLQGTKIGPAEAVRFLQYRFKHRRKISRRGIDDLQDLGSRGFACECLVTLGFTLGKLALQIGDEPLGIG